MRLWLQLLLGMPRLSCSKQGVLNSYNFGRIDILACIAQGGMDILTSVETTSAEGARILFDQGPVYTM